MASRKPKVRITALGGLNEIGKNITLFESGNDIIIVDCGVAFPEDDMLGIDLVIPDMTYLVKNANKIKGLFLTHGHEDHIGSVPYLLKQINIPIFGTRLTLGLLSNKLKEHNLLNSAKLNEVAVGEKIAAGKFKVEFIRMSHSIADAAAFAIYTDAGVIFHSGDFKVDYTPIDGEMIDLQRIAELGKKGVQLMLCESTNVESKGYTMSEATVGTIFEEIFDESPTQRIMVATFSSNIHRIQQVIQCSKKHGRKVAIIGRSMVNAVKTATELGYLEVPDNILIEVSEMHNFRDEQITIVTTGSQGESMAALSRIAFSEHRQIQVREGDRIVISASPIPGNEKTVFKVINELFKKGADVIYEALMETHVSGHAKQEELKLIHALVKPRYFMPVHGEFRHLKQHKELAVNLGMNKNNVFVMGVGETLELTKDSCRATGETVPSGHILVDGLGIGDVGNIVLRDRKHLSQDGLMVVVITIDGHNGQVVAGPDIISRGFVYVRESEQLMDEAREAVRNALINCEHKKITEWSYIKSVVKDILKEFLWKKTKRSPMILPIIMEV